MFARFLRMTTSGRTILENTQYTQDNCRTPSFGCPIMQSSIHALSDLTALAHLPGMEAQARHVIHRLGVRLCCVLVILPACLPTNMCMYQLDFQC